MKNKISKPNVYSLEKIEKLRLETLRDIERTIRNFYIILTIALILLIASDISKGEVWLTPIILVIPIVKITHELIFFLPAKFKGMVFYFSTLLIALPSTIGVFLSVFILIYNLWFVVLIISLFSLPLLCEKVKKEIFEHKTKKFRQIFKYQYLYPRIKRLGYNYFPNSLPSKNEFYLSYMFFYETLDILAPNDKITGKRNGVNFTLSDLGDSLFFCADLNKQVSLISVTFLYSFGEPIISEKLEQIELENIEFNKTFRIYTDRPKNAWYILTPLLMQQLLELKKIVNYL